MKEISIVVPCYNEEDIVEIFYNKLVEVLESLKEYNYEIIFIDDGSKDNTIRLLKKIKLKNNKVKIISFSRNFGKESAMLAGLENSKGDYVVVMDSDLQHPPEKIIEMVNGVEERF